MAKLIGSRFDEKKQKTFHKVDDGREVEIDHEAVLDRLKIPQGPLRPIARAIVQSIWVGHDFDATDEYLLAAIPRAVKDGIPA